MGKESEMPMEFMRNMLVILALCVISSAIHADVPRLIISNCEDADVWSGGKLGKDHVKQGKSAIKWAHGESSSISISQIPHDWSEYNQLSFWLYSQKATGSRFMLILPSENDKIEGIRDISGSVREYMHNSAAKQYISAVSLAEPGAESLMPQRLESPPVDSGVKPITEKRLGPREAVIQIMQLLEDGAKNIDSHRDQISKYGVEIHKKFSIPFSCIIFVLLGAPLAIRSGKKGMTMSIGFSILFFLIYYIFLISGEKLADRRFIVPWLSMWLPNIVLFLAAGLLIHSTVREARTINWEHVNFLKRLRRRR